ncbi:MAG TPA: N-acetylmuramoyl-L-alanine amidase [Nitrospiria bacterium]
MILAFLVGSNLLGPVSFSEAGRSADEIYKSGRHCQDRLHDSSKLQKYRENWEKCIRIFEGLLSGRPDPGLTEKSLLNVGELSEGLYRRSRNSRDLEKARSAYRDLSEKFPDGLYGKSALKRLANMDRLYPGISQQPAAVTVENVRHWIYPEYTRMVLDFDREVRFHQGPPDPAHMKIALENSRLSPKARSDLAALNDGILKRVTVRQIGPDGVEVEIDYQDLSQPPKILPLSNPDRLVIDLFTRAPSFPLPPFPPSNLTDVPPAGSATGGKKYAQALPFEIRTIVIDPGHGGRDPGAVGRSGLTEKDIVLDIGLRLRSLIRERMGKTVIMTRDTDTFIPLDDRTLIANSKNADLFISIHVNSHPSRRVRGVEVYHLGQASDRRAMVVAARENNISLKSLGSLDHSVRQILFDLGREYNLDQSRELAHHALSSIKSTLAGRFRYPITDHGVKRAPFYVLLNSNMPSILAEVSFISNVEEEKLLRKGEYRQALAESLYQGIRNYLAFTKAVS